MDRSTTLEYHRSLNWMIRGWSALTLVLVTAGALTAGQHAGLSIPDWPLAYGRLVPPLVGGIRYEYTHRVLATLVGILSIVTAFWLQRVESRRWLRTLGWLAVAGVIIQGVLGGLTVLLRQPDWLTAFHASVAQIFFLLTVALAIFTSRGWITARGSGTAIAGDAPAGAYRWGAAATAAILAQILLGAAYRHKALGILPHAWGAVAVSLLAIVAAAKALNFSSERRLRVPAMLLLTLLFVQIGLGIWTYIVKLATIHAAQPPAARVALATLHLVGGSFLLACSLWLTLRARQYAAPRLAECVAEEAVEA